MNKQVKLVAACTALLFSGIIIGFFLSISFQPIYETLTGSPFGLIGRGGIPSFASSPGLESTYSKAGPATSVTTTGPGGGSGMSYSLPEGRKVIMEGYVRLRVGGIEDVSRVAERASRLADAFGGYVGEMYVGEDYAVVLLKVPQEKFNKTLEELKKLASVIEVSTTARDVTEQYIDLEARLKALRAQEERLLQLLSQAKTVEELLKVEDYLTRVRSNIEWYEAQLKNLERSVQFSSIRVHIEAPPKEIKPIVTFPSFDPMPALASALGLLYSVIYGTIILLIGFSPLMLAGVFGYLAYTKFVKTRVKMKQA
ncbi:MAG: DUF4349 domain-containing protein [Thermofilaceae archaeon]